MIEKVIITSRNNHLNYREMRENSVIIHGINPQEFKQVIQELVRNELKKQTLELEVKILEDELLPVGRASRLCGLCVKSFRILAETGKFTIYTHLGTEKRYSKREILEYRNKYVKGR